MSKQQKQVTALVLPASPNEDSEVSNLIKEYLYHWPLFVLGVLMMGIAAYYYLSVSKPIYPITATIQFTNSTTSDKQPINSNKVDQLDILSQPINVVDEINVITSKKMIYPIVQKLQLWMDYTQKDGMQTTNLYKRAPVYFSFTDTNFTISPAGVKLDITIKDGNCFLTEDDSGQQRQYSFSTPVKSSFGTWQLKPTSNLKEYIGSTISIQIQDPDMVSDNYQSSIIKVEQEAKDGALVDLSMKDAVPNRGRDILNGLIDQYKRSNETDKFNMTHQLLDFLDIRIDSLKLELDSAENALALFKNQQGISDIIEDAASYRNIKQNNIETLNNITVDLSTLENLEDYANSTSTTVKLPSGGTLLNDDNISDIYQKLAELQLEREEKLAITPEANPLFNAIDNQIDALKKELDARVKEKINTLKSSLQANQMEMQAANARVQSLLNKVPSQVKEYNILQRNMDSKADLYKLLTSKREELRMQYAALIPDFKIVDDAHAGKMKWPIAPVVYVLALALGLGFPAGLLYMRRLSNIRIVSRKQIEHATEAPVIAEIVEHYSKSPIVFTQERGNFMIGEQFRVLRTNLYHLLGYTEGGRVTLFTSSVSGEGKCFISSNLAVTMAYNSRKTIILEMDMRKPKITSIFGLTPDYPGISEYISGKCSDLYKMIRPSGIPGLDVLGCGAILPNPSELLETDKLDQLIRELRAKYDDIIINSPPIHLFTDSLIIARTADACLYVVRQGYTHKEELHFIQEIYKGNRFKKFTLILNAVKRESASYSYIYDKYGSSYSAYVGKEKWSFSKSTKAILKRFWPVF
jgi:tyrosine-protein kinase Etk/Wzc